MINPDAIEHSSPDIPFPWNLMRFQPIVTAITYSYPINHTSSNNDTFQVFSGSVPYVSYDILPFTTDGIELETMTPYT